jgi:biopolymer transport protein ExbD
MRIRRADEEELRPDLTPLVDVVFLLIIFFMVSTHFIERSVEIDPDIPKSKQGLAPEQIKRQIVEINDQRRIFLNGEELPLKSLA